MSNEQKAPQLQNGTAKKLWQRPELKPAGKVGDVLQGGTGKATVTVGDPGESQKVPSMDM